jgi:hypothetical protein
MRTKAESLKFRNLGRCGPKDKQLPFEWPAALKTYKILRFRVKMALNEYQIRADAIAVNE